MCIVCVEELCGFVGFVATVFPFLRARLSTWQRNNRKPHLSGQTVIVRH